MQEINSYNPVSGDEIQRGKSVLKRESIFLKTNALLFLITSAICLIAAVQLWVGHRIKSESQQLKKIEIPVAVRSMTMRSALVNINSNLLEYVLGEAEEKEEYYKNLEIFHLNRNGMPDNALLTGKLEHIDTLVRKIEKHAKNRIFNVYDPIKEKQARVGIEHLQRSIGAPLQALLESQKATEITDASAGIKSGSISADDFLGLQHYLEMNNTVSKMLSDLDKFVLGDPTARQEFFHNAAEFEKLLEELKPLETRSEELKSIESIERVFNELKTSGVNVFTIYHAKHRADALRVIDELEHGESKESQAILDELANNSRDAVQKKILDLGDLALRTNIIMLSCIAAAICLMVFGSRFIRRRIIVPVHSITNIIGQLRKGEHEFDIASHANDDEINDIIKALSEFQSELHELEQLRNREARQYKELESRELQLLSKSAALEAANRDLEQFVHIASHDLREPLKQISGFAELLEYQTEGKLNDETQDSVSRIQSYAERMCSLIDDLRTLTKVSSSTFEQEPCDLAAIYRDVLIGKDQTIQECNAQLETGKLPTLNCTPALMWQLFDNLLQNALKHGSTPLTIRVNCTQNDANVTRIVFSNTSKEIHGDIERLVLPFVRGVGPRGTGTGMGLTICKKIIDAHGGVLRITSEDGWFSVCMELPHEKTSETDIGSSFQER